jgi:hypothetical protein
MKYKNGDRIIITDFAGNDNIKIGDKGTICDVPEGIYFDKHIEGHDCGGHCRSGHGWYVQTGCFKKLERQLEFNF